MGCDVEESLDSLCFVSSQTEEIRTRIHCPMLGKYDGVPRLYCQKCGAWLENLLESAL